MTDKQWRFKELMKDNSKTTSEGKENMRTTKLQRRNLKDSIYDNLDEPPKRSTTEGSIIA